MELTEQYELYLFNLDLMTDLYLLIIIIQLEKIFFD